MARKYYFRSTNLATPLHTVTHEKEMNLTVQSGGGTGLTSAGVAEGTNANLYVFTTPSGEPNQADWPAASVSGPYSISWDVSAAGANMLYRCDAGTGAFGHLARVASDLSSETDLATVGFGDFSGTGIKTQSLSGNVAGSSGSASDRAEMMIHGRNTNSMMSTETITLDVDSADSWFEGPWEAAPGGTPHTATPADTLSLADARALARGKKPADSLSLADQFSRLAAFLRTPADTVALTDQATTARQIVRALSDSVTLADQATPSEGAVDHEQPVADTLALADLATPAWVANREQGDQLALTDEFARTTETFRTIADSLTLADEATPAPSGGTAHEQDISDFLALYEEVILDWFADRTTNDTVALTDELVRALELFRSVADSVDLTDAQAKAVLKAIADTLALADEATPAEGGGAVDHEQPVNDLLGIADELLRVIAASRTVEDLLGVSDSVDAVEIPGGSTTQRERFVVLL